ncbi:MAG: LCP family protein [Lachnospira sp.]|nr:LCP family protein [Lachnospira sp.]
MITMFTRTHKDIESVFRKTTKNRKKMKYRKKRGMVALIGILFVFIQFLVSVLFLKNLITLDILPFKYLVIIILFLVFILCYNFTSQYTRTHIVGKILAIVLSVILVFGYTASGKVKNTLDSISDSLFFNQENINNQKIIKKDESFIVYISGNDEYGKITQQGKSDVNILATINPKTKQILLVTTPRDYYINISGFDERGNLITGLDKFTHAGNAGIQYSIEALENLYGIDVDYFFKINFDGCINIVDAMGGITIYSDIEFTNGTNAAPEQYNFVVGANDCDGAKTLAFVRERECFIKGDIQRGINQQAAITAMLHKVISPSILLRYTQILDAVSDMLLTNMPVEVITGLVKAQINNPKDWNVQSYALDYIKEESGTKLCNVYGGYRWVAMPDYNMVNNAVEMINRVKMGEIFDVSEYIK